MALKSLSRTLTDHDEIREWAEERGARPSAVRRTHKKENTGIIRLDFPGYTGEDSLEEISWDEWFEDFDTRNLALIVQDETARGQVSNFNKLVSRETVSKDSGGRRSRARGRATSSRGVRGKGSKKSSDRSRRGAVWSRKAPSRSSARSGSNDRDHQASKKSRGGSSSRKKAA